MFYQVTASDNQLRMLSAESALGTVNVSLPMREYTQDSRALTAVPASRYHINKPSLWVVHLSHWGP